MEGGYRKVPEAEPGSVEEAVPVMHKTVKNSAAVELIAHSVEEQTGVGGQGFEGTLDDLKGMCTFESRHAYLDLGVQGRGEATNLYQN